MNNKGIGPVEIIVILILCIIFGAVALSLLGVINLCALCNFVCYPVAELIQKPFGWLGKILGFVLHASDWCNICNAFPGAC